MYVKTEDSEDALFPVVDKSVGRLGLINRYDTNFSKMIRTYAMTGVEVLLHATGETTVRHLQGTGVFAPVHADKY